MERFNNIEKSKKNNLASRAKLILKDVYEENFFSIIQILDANYDENFDVIKFSDRNKHFNLFIKENEDIPKVAYAIFDEDLIMQECIKYDFINKKADLDKIHDEDIKNVVQKALNDICYAASI